eukprot:gene3975-4348_t
MPTLSEMEMSDDDSLVIEEESQGNSLSHDKRPRSGEEKEKDEGGPSATTKEGEAEVELLKTKRARRLKPFTEALLTGPYGLSRIYDEFPLKLRYNGSNKVSGGKEEKYLGHLFALYKEWAFQLHPGLSFQDVLLKCDTLGSKGVVRACVQNLRDRERERYTNEVLLPIHIDRVAQEALARAAAPPTRSTRSRHSRQDSDQNATQEEKREHDYGKEEEEKEERQDPLSGEHLVTRLEYESAEEEEELPSNNIMEDSNQNQQQPEEEQHVEEEVSKEEEEESALLS